MESHGKKVLEKWFPRKNRVFKGKVFEQIIHVKEKMCTEIENNQGRKKVSDNDLFAGFLKMMFELERLLC